MEKVLKLYTYVDGVNDIPFPSEDKQVVTSNFRGDYKRMGGAPSITCSVKHELCLDGLWTYNVYAMFNGERFFIKQIPSSSYDNTDSRYKHDIELVSERIVLDNVYVYDVVDSSSSNDKPVSNSSNFTFFGDIHEFVGRLNESLKYSKVGYSIVVDSGIVSEAKQVSFQDQFFSNAIQECYNTYNLPYYFSGKVIHVGYTDNAITHTFKYGQDESLLSIQKQNANFKIVNRVTGVGSADNIPYYYPNEYESKQEVEANGGTWVNPQTNLMPPIYRESNGSERFYNALNNKYINKNDGGFYEFENEYKVGNPREHIVNFEDIKPSIVGVTNASGVRIDMFEEFAYDEDDNDKTDEAGNYLRPYFYAKLRRFDGDFGFNLFDHSIDESEMVISMTSGSCGSCEFTIMVDEATQKNTVQVDSEGNLVRDNEGNVVFGNPQNEQNDTINNNVWIALKKDIDTFGVIMPNASHNYRPSKGDTFVILHIDLPKAYIVAAEERLKDELIKYMASNNSEKFLFSINFSRIFFAERPDILDELNENARIQIEYDGEVHELYVSSFTYSMDNNTPLPDIRVELTDTLTITQNALQNAINSIKDDIFSSYGGGDILKLGLRYFLRKDKDDRSRGLVASDKGFEVGKFKQGELGSGGIFHLDKDRNSYLELDKLFVRKIAYFVEIMIKKLSHVGGTIILSPASMRCSKVETFDTFYRCYFENERDGKTIHQEFVVGDQARAQTFNIEEGLSQNVSNQYYWRLVVGVGKNYIDLSISDCDSGSTIPQVGDDIVQLGNRNDTDRQNAIILSSYGDSTPSFRQYSGIKSYVLEDATLVTEFSPTSNLVTGKFISQSGKNLEDEINKVKVDWDKVLEQTDKEFTMWFFDYDPSSDVLPESEWTTDDLKMLHEQDLFYNVKTGFAWRYLFKDGVFIWEDVTDSDTIKALENAAKAQDTADEAKKQIEDIVSDGVLSVVEKKEVRKEWDSIASSYAINIENANKYNVSHDDYTTSYITLGTYLNNGDVWDGISTPIWLNEHIGVNTIINPSEYRQVWVDYYDSEKVLLDSMSEYIKDIADSKIRNFVDQPIPPYDKGDRWCNAYFVLDGVVYADNDDMVCVRSKTKDELFDISDWQPSSSMNSEKRYAYDAAIKNLGDQISLTIEKTDKIEGDVTNLGLKIDAAEENISLYIQKIEDNKSSISALQVTTNEISSTVSSFKDSIDDALSNASNAKTIASTAKELAITATMTGMYSGEEYNQTTNPWQNWSSGTEYKHVGAIWYNPNTGVTKRYIGTDGTNLWEEVDDDVYSSATFVFQNQNKWSAIATNFNSDGSIKSTSGIVTTANFATIFSESDDVRAEVGVLVEDAMSTVKITADNVDINNGYVVITKDSAKIGHFNISSKGLDMDGDKDAYINFNYSGYKFIRINSGDGALFYGRHDSGTIMDLNAYGTNAIALEVSCNSSGTGLALKSTGDVLLRARYSSELINIAGLALAYKTGSSFSGPSNNDISLATAWVDFLIVNGSTSLPSASTCPGKILFVKRKSSGSYSASSCYLSDGTYASSKSWDDNDSRMFLSDGSYWYEFLCS